jgi:hypothetical protein
MPNSCSGRLAGDRLHPDKSHNFKEFSDLALVPGNGGVREIPVVPYLPRKSEEYVGRAAIPVAVSLVTTAHGKSARCRSRGRGDGPGRRRIIICQTAAFHRIPGSSFCEIRTGSVCCGRWMKRRSVNRLRWYPRSQNRDLGHPAVFPSHPNERRVPSDVSSRLAHHGGDTFEISDYSFAA